MHILFPLNQAIANSLSASKIFISSLTILTEKCVLLNSVQEFIEIEAWLLLNFSPCLHNQLISTFLLHIKECRTDV